MLMHSQENELLQSTAPNSSEMGRRKLPSLPSVSVRCAPSTSNVPAPSTQIKRFHQSDHGQIPCSSAESIHYSQDMEKRKLQSGVVLFQKADGELELRQMSLEEKKLTQSHNDVERYRCTDSAIFPGAQFKSTFSPCQTAKISDHSRHLVKMGASSVLPHSIFSSRQIKSESSNKSLKTSFERVNAETLIQLRFKKELREVLKGRRQALETCDIEAGHRQYMINRMLTSGLMPISRLVELDAIPAVVKCTLPKELIEGARVTHNPNVKSRSKTPAISNQQESKQSNNVGVRIHCQVDEKSSQQSANSFPSSSYSCHIYSTSKTDKPIVTSSVPSVSCTSLSPRKVLEKVFLVNSWTQTPLEAETQTNNSQEQSPSSRDYSSQLYRRQTDAKSLKNHLCTFKPRKKKSRIDQFENRFFTDSSNSWAEAELKRGQVQREIDQRRRNLEQFHSSMIDLRKPYNTFQGDDTGFLSLSYNDVSFSPVAYSPAEEKYPPFTSSKHLYDEVSRTEPPYNRRHYFASSRENLSQLAGAGYNSLPRNYERLCAEDFQSRHKRNLEQAYAPISEQNHFASLKNLSSISSHHHRNGALYNSISPRSSRPSQQFLSGMSYSENYLPSRFGSIRDDSYAPPLTERRNHQNFAERNFEDYNRGIIADYANYLNQKFALNQQFETMQQPVDRLSSYIPHVKHHNLKPHATQQRPLTKYYTQNKFYGEPYDEKHPGVYSRSEMNYGSRPMQLINDYGNHWHDSDLDCEDSHLRFFEIGKPPINSKIDCCFNNCSPENLFLARQSQNCPRHAQSILKRQHPSIAINAVWPESGVDNRRRKFRNYLKNQSLTNNKIGAELDENTMGNCDFHLNNTNKKLLFRQINKY